MKDKILKPNGTKPKLQFSSILIIGGLLFYLSLFYADKINLATADLGRHLKNGELFGQTFTPLKTNFYSYTEPKYISINHHWGSGTVLYSVWKFIGFKGLSYFYILLHLLTVFILLKLILYSLPLSVSAFFTLLSLPLITMRTEIRPEGFSYLIFAVDFFLLYRYYQGKLKFKTLCIIPVLQILWVNLHIYFFLGWLLCGVHFIVSMFRQKEKFKSYLYIFTLTVLGSLINPFGLEGALSPLTIFRQYGYMIVENQSVLFLQKRFPANLVYLHFELTFILTVVGIIFIILKNQWRDRVAPIIIILSLGVLAGKTSRAIPLFGFIFIPVVTEIYFTLIAGWRKQRQRLVSRSLLTGTIILIFLGLTNRSHYYSPYYKSNFGVGLLPGVNQSAEFIKTHKIRGPIFNNYDLGGYLIFHLFPQERVFVDNRPESYSVPFFKEVYIPMQEKENVWQKIDRQYKFNVIYFYRHDITPWAQPFLINRVQDKLWAPVYVDNFTLILLKRTPENVPLIQKYELPESLFRIVRQ